MLTDWSPSALDAMLSGLRAQIDVATSPAFLTLHAAPEPTTPGTGGGTEQARINLAQPCGTVASQALTLTLPLEGLRSGAEPLAWARLTTGSGTWVADWPVGVTGSGAAVELDSRAGYPGGTVRITSAVIAF